MRKALLVLFLALLALWSLYQIVQPKVKVEASSVEGLYDQVSHLSCKEAQLLVSQSMNRIESRGGMSENDLHTLRLFHAYTLITRCGLNKKTKADIYTGQLKGMVDALNDPHSSLLEPEAHTDLKKSLTGKFIGIGLELESVISGGKFSAARVVAPIDDSPAERAGLKAKDVIIAVDEKKTVSYKNLEGVVHDITGGPPGSKVTLTVVREGAKDSLVFSIIRDKIVIKNVKTKLLANNWVWMKLTTFGGDTFCEDIVRSHEELERKHRVKGTVLDLRNNPGGGLYLAHCAASAFAPEGLRNTLILAEENRDGVIPQKRSALEPKNLLRGKPLIVLVNGGSASASEIVAKACQGLGYCTVVGDGPTFGKGSIQTVFPIGDEKMAVKVTTAQYLVYHKTGTLMPVQGVGVTPNIRIKTSGVTEGESTNNFRLRESDLEGRLLASTKAKDVPPENTKETNPELYRVIVEALKAPELKVDELE